MVSSADILAAFREVTNVKQIERSELYGLLQDGIGADRISDMTAHIIRGHILAFSQRVGTSLGLPLTEVRYGANYAVPRDPSTGLASHRK